MRDLVLDFGGMRDTTALCKLLLCYTFQAIGSYPKEAWGAKPVLNILGALVAPAFFSMVSLAALGPTALCFFYLTEGLVLQALALPPLLSIHRPLSLYTGPPARHPRELFYPPGNINRRRDNNSLGM